MKNFKPQLVSVRDESLIPELKEALANCDHKPEIIPGEEGIIEASRNYYHCLVAQVRIARIQCNRLDYVFETFRLLAIQMLLLLLQE